MIASNYFLLPILVILMKSLNFPYVLGIYNFIRLLLSNPNFEN